MSRVINTSLATIQFQVNARQANAAMQALQGASDDLNRAIERVNKQIEGLGSGAVKENPTFVALDNQLKGLKKDLKDVEKAQRDFLKGAKAADQLWQAAQQGNIESLSFRSIKAGMSGLKKRQEGLRPESAQDMQDYRIIKQVLDEADRVMKEAGADVQHVVQTIREGGKVSEQTMRQTISTLKELKGSVDETDADFRTWGSDLDFMEGKLQEFSDAQRRAKGEIVDANDARREMNKLTEEGRQKAESERQFAEWQIKFYEQRGQELDKQREKIQQNIDATRQQMDAQHKLIEDKHSQLAADEQAFNTEQQNRRTTIEGLREEARLRREEANLKADEAEQQRRMIDLQAQTGASQETLNEGERRYIHLLGEAAEANNTAATAENKVAEAEHNATEAQVQQNKHIQEGMQVIGEMGKTYDSLNTKLRGQEQALKENGEAITKNANDIAEAEQMKAQARQLSIKRMEEMLAAMKKEYYEEELTNEQRIEHYRKMRELQEALDKEKGKPVLDMMEQRMDKLGSLSTSAVTETKKFWQAMADGAEKGSKELATAEAHLKTITEEEAKRSHETTRNQARGIFGDLSKKSTEEIRVAIDAAKRLIDTYDSGSPAAQRLSQAIVNAEEHLKQYGVEAERAARREAQAIEDAAQKRKEADAMMRQQLDQGTALSASALNTQRQYWQRLIDDPKTAKESLAGYRYELERTMELQEKQTTTTRNERAARLNGNLADMSEGEIREAIEAGKQLIQTYKSGSTEAETLAKKIVAAEEHVKQYGVEAQRAAQREAQAIAEAAQKRKEADTTMRKQLYNQQNLSESALKAQEQYWRRLIDDPNTASQSLHRYEKDLELVHQMQEQMAREKVRTEGESALAFFEGGIDNASANDIKENAAALKKYRDSLPQEDEADTIKKINDYLIQAGAAAEKATAKTMTMKEALRTGLDARSGNFKGTVEQLMLAKKTLEDLQKQAVKGGLAWRRMQEGIDSINLELQRTGHLSGEVMDILNKPKGKSLNELKQAVEQGRKALASMRTETEQDRKAFDELAAKIKAADQEMKQIAGTAKATSSAFEKAWTRLKTYVTFYVSAAAAIQKVIGTFGDLMELSDKMGEVRKTTGFTADEVGRLSDNLKKMDVRSSLTELMDVATKAGQLGMKTEQDVLGFTEAANKLMIALPEMGAEAATEMMKVAMATGEVDKIRRQMQEGTIKGSSEVAVALEKVGSTIDQLRANSAAAAPQITDFVKRLGAVGAQSGITIDQVAAMGSTIDALGLRIEMSATALSRMIPAIKNNAFAVAKAIKVEPSVLRNLFETGRGMEAILMIFQHIKDSGMNEDSIEKMLGMAGMQEVMKELNQMGARAGIVFAGLSQNVDMLREHLEIAGDAYEENMAIEREFQKMNETTAAKWARFKNELEETFVGDRSQRFFGWVIDQMRGLVNVISGNVEPSLKSLNIALWTAAAYFTALRLGIGKLVVEGFGLLIKGLVGAKNALIALTTTKGLKSLGDSIHFWALETKAYIVLKWQLARAHDAEAAAAIRAKLANNALAGSMKANVILAIVAAIAMLIWKLKEWNDKAKEGAREAAKFQAELDKETKKVDKLFESVGKASVKTDEATKKVEEARKALAKAKEQLDGSKESTDRLTKAEEDLAVAEEELKNKQATHARTIQDINSQYGHYLGFMLSEVSNAEQLAAARELINEKLRETITLKRKEAALERIEQSEGEDRDKAYADLYDRVYGNAWTTDKNGRKMKSAETGAFLMRDITDMAQNDYESPEQFRQAVMSLLTGGYKGKAGDITKIADDAEAYYKKLKNIREKNKKIEEQFASEDRANRNHVQDKLVRQYDIETARYREIEKEYNEAKGDAKKEAAAKLLKEMDTINEMVENAEMHFETDEKKGWKAKDSKGNEITEKQLLEQFNEYTEAQVNAMKNRRDALLKEAGNLYQPRKTVNGELTSHIPDLTNNGWGADHAADSTDWKKMTAEQLVNRRKQMKEFVNAIQDDTDVTRVLKEDSALQKAIENGMSRDVRTVIEWYNTQRLKIQDELHARHLTNTGDWMDPKKEKARKKMLHDETRAYLDELDAYYTERKAKIQEAGNEEGLTEAEIRNRTLANEAEWRQRRMELQMMYGGKMKDVAQKEQDDIFNIIAERTEDDVAVVKGTFQKTLDFVEQIAKTGEQGEKEAAEFRAKMDKQAMQDYNKEQAALHQHLKAIQDIIDKERPFNGITKNLRENLVTMDILTADMRQEYNELLKAGADMTDFNTRQAEEELKRTTFLLGEAENAYSTTVEEVMARMGKAGMTAWAEAIGRDPQMKEALMAQLHQTYDAIQEAIKKEASLMKKQAETMWNNILLPGGDGKTTVKDAFEQTIAQLGIDQGRVSRANSLIGAGAASERVADRLAIKQMQLQLTMQQHYYNLMRKQGLQRIQDLQRQTEELEKQGKLEEAKRVRQDKEHVEMSLRLAMTKEQTDLLKQQEDIIARTEESQNRLYTALKEWGDLLASSLREVMEASNAGNAEYYNERAKLDLTGKGGPGAGTYIVIDDAGTEDAKAHYEYLSEREALEREHEIEQQNAQAEAWKKVMDDLNAKMSEQITDWMNAQLQNQAVNANTDALGLNTTALETLSEQLAQGITINNGGDSASSTTDTGTHADNGFASEKQAYYEKVSGQNATTGTPTSFESSGDFATDRAAYFAAASGEADPMAAAQAQMVANDAVTQNAINNSNKQTQVALSNDQKATKSSQSSFAKMTAAANLYGIAYQTMANDNLSTAQKVQLFAVQAAGNAAIAMLTTDMATTEGEAAVSLPGILGKAASQLGPIAGPIAFAAMSALLGGLMGLAVSKIAKSKSTIAQATGASASAGKLATGMLTYAEGNVNELTDPSTLTPGRQYNVDGADGKTYRARYMGVGAKTHITNGPEFHLVGEKGREAIIDAHTTRNIQLNEPEIWRSIQTLYNGGSLSHTPTRRRRGVRAYADGNIEDFEGMGADGADAYTNSGFTPEMAMQMQASLDRNSEVMERALREGIKGVFDVYGKGGLVDSYDRGKKTLNRHGEKY